MSYATHVENLKRAIKELQSTRVRETTLMILDEIALIKARVINKGETADGGQFKLYSKAVVPSWYHKQHLQRMGFNADKKVKDIIKKKGYFTSYHDLREETGRPVDHRNFSLSGKMWKGVEAIVIDNDPVSTTYVIGSSDGETQKLINYNKAESGDFLAISQEEQNLLHQLNRQRVIGVLQKNGVI